MGASLRRSYRSGSRGGGGAVSVTTALLVALALLLAISTVTADTQKATAVTLNSHDVSTLASSAKHTSSSVSAHVAASASAGSSSSSSSSSSSIAHILSSSSTSSHHENSTSNSQASSFSSSSNNTVAASSNSSSFSASASHPTEPTTSSLPSSTPSPNPNMSTSTSTSPSTSSSTSTSSTKAPTSSQKPSDGVNKESNVGEGGVPMVLVIVLIFVLIGAVLYSSRAFPKTCPFFRSGGGAGPVSALQTQQYARLDGGAFYGDEEDYRGMEPSFAAANTTTGRPGLGHQHARGYSGPNLRGDLIFEMQEKLKGEPPIARTEGRTHSPLPPQHQRQYRESAVPSAVAEVADHNPAALDALFGAHSSSGAATPAASPAPIPLHSKNSLKSLRKGKLGPASAVTPFGATKSVGEGDRNSGSVAGAIAGGLSGRL